MGQMSGRQELKEVEPDFQPFSEEILNEPIQQTMCFLKLVPSQGSRI